MASLVNPDRPTYDENALDLRQQGHSGVPTGERSHPPPGAPNAQYDARQNDPPNVPPHYPNDDAHGRSTADEPVPTYLGPMSGVNPYSTQPLDPRLDASPRTAQAVERTPGTTDAGGRTRPYPDEKASVSSIKSGVAPGVAGMPGRLAGSAGTPGAGAGAGRVATGQGASPAKPVEKTPSPVGNVNKPLPPPPEDPAVPGPGPGPGPGQGPIPRKAVGAAEVGAGAAGLAGRQEGGHGGVGAGPQSGEAGAGRSPLYLDYGQNAARGIGGGSEPQNTAAVGGNTMARDMPGRTNEGPGSTGMTGTNEPKGEHHHHLGRDVAAGAGTAAAVEGLGHHHRHHHARRDEPGNYNDSSRFEPHGTNPASGSGPTHRSFPLGSGHRHHDANPQGVGRTEPHENQRVPISTGETPDHRPSNRDAAVAGALGASTFEHRQTPPRTQNIGTTAMTNPGPQYSQPPPNTSRRLQRDGGGNGSLNAEDRPSHHHHAAGRDAAGGAGAVGAAAGVGAYEHRKRNEQGEGPRPANAAPRYSSPAAGYPSQGGAGPGTEHQGLAGGRSYGVAPGTVERTPTRRHESGMDAALAGGGGGGGAGVAGYEVGKHSPTDHAQHHGRLQKEGGEYPTELPPRAGEKEDKHHHQTTPEKGEKRHRSLLSFLHRDKDQRKHTREEGEEDAEEADLGRREVEGGGGVGGGGGYNDRAGQTPDANVTGGAGVGAAEGAGHAEEGKHERNRLHKDPPPQVHVHEHRHHHTHTTREGSRPEDVLTGVGVQAPQTQQIQTQTEGEGAGAGAPGAPGATEGKAQDGGEEGGRRNLVSEEERKAGAWAFHQR